jgi:hypothetical protein
LAGVDRVSVLMAAAVEVANRIWWLLWKWARS